MSSRAEPLYGGQHPRLRIRLQIGRTYSMAGDTAKTKAAYNDFLTLWERCRPRHLHLERSQSGVCEVAVIPCQVLLANQVVPGKHA
jgi:hypothetical protein